VPPMEAVFKVAPPHLNLFLLSLAVAIVSGGWFGVVRSLRRSFAHPPRPGPASPA